MPVTSNSVTIHYFAVLRDLAGASREVVSLNTDETPTSLYERLASRHGFQFSAGDLRMAVNDEFVSAHFPLKDGDQIAFIPPVAGG